jgi:hypothetical protein
MLSLSMAQFSLRQNLNVTKTPTPSGPVPIPYPNSAGSVPAGLNPKINGMNPVPKPKSSMTSNPYSYRVNSSLLYFAATNDLGLAYPDVPMGGRLDDVLQFAWSHTLPVFRFTYLPMEIALVVYCWVTIFPFAVIPQAFVYIDSSFRNSPQGVQDFFVYQWLIGMPTQISPLTIHSDADGLALLSPPESLYLPFVPPAPFWPQGQAFPPNPMLQFARGGNVPVDASGLSAFVADFV